MNELNTSKKSFFIWLTIFVIFSGLVIILKKVLLVKDFIDNSNVILVISPLLFITSMILGYGLYDRIMRKARQSTDTNEKINQFNKANKIKFIFLSLGGIVIALTLLLIWKADYLYLLGIALILLLIAYPSRTKYDIEFNSERFNKKSPEETQTKEGEE